MWLHWCPDEHSASPSCPESSTHGQQMGCPQRSLAQETPPHISTFSYAAIWNSPALTESLANPRESTKPEGLGVQGVMLSSVCASGGCTSKTSAFKFCCLVCLVHPIHVSWTLDTSPSVGLIQLGQEQVLIQPLNNSQGPFSGREHLIRRKWSLTPNPSAEAQRSGQLCKVLTEKKKPRRGRPSRDWRERRNAIQLTSEHTVETLVVADADMVQYHGAEAAQRFILTVMNMVYNMFQHQSLGIKINIQVTKLVLLRQRPAKLSIGHHGERSLESFCHWQNEEYGGARYLGNNQVPGGKDDPPLVDAAVFVTRTDFCVHKDEPCDTVDLRARCQEATSQLLLLCYLGAVSMRELLAKGHVKYASLEGWLTQAQAPGEEQAAASNQASSPFLSHITILLFIGLLGLP
ncbi:PREDICTED: A disintegrin and metalloproteinase with thrombospondin motifs 17 [Mandrillus leucophaeus]|uniref:A disintegrin and metalloproteinase with thrombospondin motifs 17 n=1 Tax=Mandrillus leucophaeus TaxID=9568 RepID=UPI0005F51CBA|nr:PREDICTED: A disintegrin and metalloproteinase with thrombospondin motifs 17 [Mandrillus leucophaeus]